MKGQKKEKSNINKICKEKHDFRGRTPNLIYKVLFLFSFQSEGGLCLLPTRSVFHGNSEYH